VSKEIKWLEYRCSGDLPSLW